MCSKKMDTRSGQNIDDDAHYLFLSYHDSDFLSFVGCGLWSWLRPFVVVAPTRIPYGWCGGSTY